MSDLTAFDAAISRARSTYPTTHAERHGPAVRAGSRTCGTPEEVFAAYRPAGRHETSNEVWQEIGGFVRDCVSKTPCDSAATAKARMSYATAFVTWCHTQDVPLLAEAVFTPERVETYAVAVLAGRPRRSVAVIRGALRTIGIACTKRAAWPRPATPLRKNAYLAAPYATADVAGFWSAADAQATGRRTHVFRTLLTLGLGAGLSSAEMFDLHADQVLTHPDVPDVRVIVLPDRLVPARHDLTGVLDGLCEAQPGGRLLGGRTSEAAAVKNKAGALRRGLDIPASLPDLSLSRLRTTWAVTVLSEGVTVAEFLRMAGTTSAKSLELYIPHVRVRTEPEWLRLAAGTAHAAEKTPLRGRSSV